MPAWYGTGRVRQGHNFKEACQRNITTEVVFKGNPQGETLSCVLSGEGDCREKAQQEKGGPREELQRDRESRGQRPVKEDE